MLRLLTLGGLSLSDEGTPVTGAASQRSRLALLAVLATAGPAGVARDKLLALLWPESDDERARHALKQGVYALRRDLGTENAIVGTATLSLDSSVVASDVREFDDAIARGDDGAATALYAGPFLDGVFVKAAPEFDQWAASERARLERGHLDAIGRLARSADASGDTHAAVQWWRRAAAAEPLSGRVALSLMRALANAGDVSAAIQHARVHEVIVRSELDAPADEAVSGFAEELRRGDFVARPVMRSTPLTVDVVPAERPGVAAPEPSLTVPAVADASLASADDRKNRVIRWRWRVALSAASVLAALALMGSLLPGIRSRAAEAFRAPHDARSARRIVVARFENLTGDRSLDPLGQMTADFLAQSLLDANFEVVDSRTSAGVSRMLAQLAPARTAAELASELASQTGAATVVTGRYYRHGDSLRVDAKIVDPVRGALLREIAVSGSLTGTSALVHSLSDRVTVAMTGSKDTTAGAGTASLTDPPSLEAYEHISRAWGMFFSRPADTASVFLELARASAVDTGYTGPLEMRAYVLDVKEQWPALANAVKQLEIRRARMGRFQRGALALFEADLRGDLLGRLSASRDLMRMSPGSADVALLVAVSASYLNRAQEAHDVLLGANPDLGINQVSPMYWAWRAASEHALARYDDELRSAMEEARRFPSSAMAAMSHVRAYAATGRVGSIDSLLARAGLAAPDPTWAARDLALLAARELRAHDRDRESAALFKRVAALPVGGTPSPAERRQHALALYEAGAYGDARAAYAALALASPGDIEAIGRIGAIAARTGDSATVRSVDRQLMQWHEAYAFGAPALWRAHLAALSGRGGEAVSLLHAAMLQGTRLMDLGIVTLHEEGDFRPLWKDAGFRELVRPRDGQATVP
ncbi:hypothetical protein BH11GEM1_BH11GEM1_08820 [soil metagenome]